MRCVAGRCVSCDNAVHAIPAVIVQRVTHPVRARPDNAREPSQLSNQHRCAERFHSAGRIRFQCFSVSRAAGNSGGSHGNHVVSLSLKLLQESDSRVSDFDSKQQELRRTHSGIHRHWNQRVRERHQEVDVKRDLGSEVRMVVKSHTDTHFFCGVETLSPIQTRHTSTTDEQEVIQEALTGTTERKYVQIPTGSTERK